ncbi:hypothetical protein QJS10_CPB18g01577 [Acorus calamus]|uniref:GMP synthase (glutamine-hydrolyzing) n=1 Tax=Acorus calamus TaxID=4465 RepID=A0AAV9CP68_ACOCL|nr:hypothetical protein QJS10_CPB18g01577 [Acorus calamus]
MEIEVTGGGEGRLYGGDAVGKEQTVWMSHADEAARLPEGFRVVARSGQGAVAAIEYPERRLYGLQYHPENNSWLENARCPGARELEHGLGKKPAFLVQGTLYPDVIESCPPPGSGRTHSHTIKSHHNVGGLPKDTKLKLIEPLKLLFKDEVRELGSILNVPEAFLKRHPFPAKTCHACIRYRFQWDLLDNVSRKICNNVRGVNRVVLDITSKPPATVEWE